MKDIKKFLQGGDLRSIADVDQLVPLIKTQNDFDTLFQFLSSDDRLIAMRAADALEKISGKDPVYLDSHKNQLISLLSTARDKELKWHLVLMVSRINLSGNELKQVWNNLEDFARDKSESKIVRVNSLSALYELSRYNKELKMEFDLIAYEVKAEDIPSINARLKYLTRE